MLTRLICLWHLMAWFDQLKGNVIAFACFVLLLWLISVLCFLFWFRDIFQDKSGSALILLLYFIAVIFTCGFIIGEGAEKSVTCDKNTEPEERTQNSSVWTELGTNSQPVQETIGEGRKTKPPRRHFSRTVVPFSLDLDKWAKHRKRIKRKPKAQILKGTTPVPLTSRSDLPDKLHTMEVDVKLNTCTEKPAKGPIDSLLSMTETETTHTIAPAFAQNSSDEEDRDDPKGTKPRSSDSSTRRGSEEKPSVRQRGNSTAESQAYENLGTMAEQTSRPIQQESGPQQTLAEASRNTATSGERTRSAQRIPDLPNPAVDSDRIRPLMHQRGLHRHQNMSTNYPGTFNSIPQHGSYGKTAWLQYAKLRSDKRHPVSRSNAQPPVVTSHSPRNSKDSARLWDLYGYFVKTDGPTQSSQHGRDEKYLNPRHTDGKTTVTVPERKDRKEPEGAVGGAEAIPIPPIVTTYNHPAFQQEDNQKEKKTKQDSDSTLVPPPVATYQPREPEAVDDTGEDTKEDSEEEEFPHEEEDIT